MTNKLKVVPAELFGEKGEYVKLSTLTTAVKDILKEIEINLKERFNTKETMFDYPFIMQQIDKSIKRIKKNFCTESKTSSQKLRGLR